MNSIQAQIIIESLRKGIPPEGFVRHFTVGRKDEIADLRERLNTHSDTVLLLKANYGSGKTHLLKFIREEALERNYAVSSVTLDSNSGVRFNRMDQIVGAVCRNIEMPGLNNEKGLVPLMDHLSEQINKGIMDNDFCQILSNHGRWDYSDVLDSKAMYVALRAWSTGIKSVQDTIVDWFYQPSAYNNQRKLLLKTLITDLRSQFRDPRPNWMFYEDGVFVMNKNGYEQSWAILRDFNSLCKKAGLSGFIILFDEFEDVITNLKNIKYQEAAFWNLFHFYFGKKFPGKTFFAVTPEFADKCKTTLLLKQRWDFDYTRFDELPMYTMSPLATTEMEELALLIFEVHGVAYGWEPDTIMLNSQLKSIVRKAALIKIEDRVRRVIMTVVKALDDLFQESM
ncbi:MAG: BREX system ATP-binding domain-containing protein [Candidatus Cloacimonadaceae bacterium]|jgi:hypothetical protein|nr:ATP-binding protein [Candidatus Cloacimonadota bacterium]MDX9949012.1 DUF2791 family P-loop domain-containing protein [Candidatus Syntrophosphaera sp.]